MVIGRWKVEIYRSPSATVRSLPMGLGNESGVVKIDLRRSSENVEYNGHLPMHLPYGVL